VLLLLTQSLSVAAAQKLLGAGVGLALIVFLEVLGQTVVVGVEDVTELLMNAKVDREVLAVVPLWTKTQVVKEPQPQALFKVTMAALLSAKLLLLVVVGQVLMELTVEQLSVLVAQAVSDCLTIFLAAVSIVVAAAVAVDMIMLMEFTVGTAVMAAVDEAQSPAGLALILLNQERLIQVAVVVADRGTQTVMVVLAVLA
jgi:hypothetical protein